MILLYTDRRINNDELEELNDSFKRYIIDNIYENAHEK